MSAALLRSLARFLMPPFIAMHVDRPLISLLPPAMPQAGPACPDAHLSAAPAAAGQPAGYAPLIKCPSGQWPPAYHSDDGSWDSSAAGSSGGLRPLLQQLVGRLPRGAAARLERLLGLAPCPPSIAPLAWHPSQPLLAAVGAGGQVQVVDYTGQLPVLGQQGSGAPPPAPLSPTLTLQHELQQGAAAAAWRPNGGKCLAVGTAQGVCLWHIGRPPTGSGSRWVLFFASAGQDLCPWAAAAVQAHAPCSCQSVMA